MKLERYPVSDTPFNADRGRATAICAMVVCLYTAWRVVRKVISAKCKKELLKKKKRTRLKADVDLSVERGRLFQGHQVSYMIDIRLVP
jgi:hypothetical protein